MKNKFAVLVAIIAVIVLVSSCGTTVYRKKRYMSTKYLKYKTNWYGWHAHHYRPRAHRGGYW